MYKHKIAAIRRMGTYLLAHDIAPGKFLRAQNLPASLLLDNNAWIERRLSLQLSNKIAHATGDMQAGLRIAELIQFGDYGAWGEGVIASRTLRDAIRFAARNICAIETGTAVALREHGPNAYLSVEFLGPVRHSPLHHAEAHLFVARKILDLASEHVPAMAHLPQEHRHRGDLEPWFGERLEYGSDRVELVFDRDALPLLLQPPLFTDPDGPEGTARGIMGRIEELMEFERPTAQAVAVALNINVRTMQRHLSAWGLTFEELLDQHRQRIAQQYLQSGELSITDIAFRLGYSDSPHFNRAFRRWTGLSPRQAQTRIAS